MIVLAVEEVELSLETGKFGLVVVVPLLPGSAVVDLWGSEAGGR